MEAKQEASCQGSGTGGLVSMEGAPFLTLHFPVLAWSGHQRFGTREPASQKVLALVS